MSIEETRALWERFKVADQAHDAEATSATYAENVVFTGTPLRSGGLKAAGRDVLCPPSPITGVSTSRR
ncbi:MAG: hypothetical protein M9925_11700 [Chloroflexi bacterium]|nr:hypothetical protein [Chloroflexota bacterium]